MTTTFSKCYKSASIHQSSIWPSTGRYVKIFDLFLWRRTCDDRKRRLLLLTWKFQPIKTATAAGKPLQSLIQRDLQPVKTCLVFSGHSVSSTATFPQLHTEKPALRGQSFSGETNPPLASFTWECSKILMWYWWKAPPRRVIDFLSPLWRISESLVFVQRFIRNRDENLLPGDFGRDQRYVHSFLSNCDGATWRGCLQELLGLAKTQKMIKQNCKLLNWESCPVVQTKKSECEERVLVL